MVNSTATASSIERLDDNTVKLTVEVGETDFDAAVDAAFKRISQQVRIPGFRRGKAPRRILEAQLGRQYGRTEALREALPGYYQQAVVEHDVDVIDSPEIEIVAGQEHGAVVFDATVEIRPVVEVAGYDNLRIEVPSPQASAADVDSEIDRLRAEHAEFVVVERPADDGDQVNIDIAGSHQDTEVPGLSAADYDYELGSGAVVAEIDENLRGAVAGDVREFEADHPDPDETEPLHFVITVNAVNEAVLPEATDGWVADATEHQTLEELRADVGGRLSEMKLARARQAAQAKLGDALACLVTRDIPEVLVSEEVDQRLREMFANLQQSGIEPGEFLEHNGQDLEGIRAELAEPAENAVKVDLALRAVARAEGLTPDDSQLAEAIEQTADSSGSDGSARLERFKELGQLSALRSQVARSKAFAWLLDNSELVDENGVAVDLRSPDADEPADPDAAAGPAGMTDPHDPTTRPAGMTDPHDPTTQQGDRP